jgi:hypothetical protein
MLSLSPYWRTKSITLIDAQERCIPMRKRKSPMFEINEYQLNVIKANISGQKYVSLVPNKEKDGDVHEAWLDNTRWNEELVAEGFLRELPTEHDEFITKMKQKFNRDYRLFIVTPLAKAMFSPVLVPIVGEENAFRNVAETIH